MTSDAEVNPARRRFLGAGLVALGGLALAGPARLLAAPAPEKSAKKEDKVEPPEDLMREHGVLRRILLIYEDLHRRLLNKAAFQPEVLGRAADIIKKFIEEYHEKLEENYLFPRFVQANVLGNLTRLLKVQHEAGRKITAFILANANAQALENAARRREVADQLHAFWRMYRPHAAREDTVLFPALRRVVSPKEFQDLGEKFEDIEKEKFGQDGFDKMVDEVAELEQALGIEDLSRFTPPPPPARLQI